MYAEEIKVVILGNSGVGKSSIMLRFVQDEFSATHPTTLGAAFMSKIWDTAGQEKYKSLAPLYYKDSRIGIIVYDITSQASFEVLKQWVGELRKQGPENIILAIVGNKADLTDRQEVPFEAAQQYAKSINAVFEVTSAKEGMGVAELFNKLAERIEVSKVPKDTAADGRQKLTTQSKKGESDKKCAC